MIIRKQTLYPIILPHADLTSPWLDARRPNRDYVGQGVQHWRLSTGTLDPLSTRLPHVHFIKIPIWSILQAEHGLIESTLIKAFGLMSTLG